MIGDEWVDVVLYSMGLQGVSSFPVAFFFLVMFTAGWVILRNVIIASILYLFYRRILIDAGAGKNGPANLVEQDSGGSSGPPLRRSGSSNLFPSRDTSVHFLESPLSSNASPVSSSVSSSSFAEGLVRRDSRLSRSSLRTLARPQSSHIIQKDGCLDKESRKLKQYNARYFLLDSEGTLTWWRGEDQVAKKGEINLLTEEVTAEMVEKVYKQGTVTSNRFRITSSLYNLNLEAPSSEDAREWVDAVKDAVEALKALKALGKHDGGDESERLSTLMHTMKEEIRAGSYLLHNVLLHDCVRAEEVTEWLISNNWAFHEAQAIQLARKLESTQQLLCVLKAPPRCWTVSLSRQTFTNSSIHPSILFGHSREFMEDTVVREPLRDMRSNYRWASEVLEPEKLAFINDASLYRFNVPLKETPVLDSGQEIWRRYFRTQRQQEKKKVIQRQQNDIGSGKSLGCFLPTNRFRAICVEIVTNPYFDWAVLVTVALSALILACDAPDTSKAVSNFVLWGDYTVTLLFVLEMMLKIVAMGFYFGQGTYLKDSWNVLDFLIVLISILSIYLSQGTTAEVCLVPVFPRYQSCLLCCYCFLYTSLL
jgi:hypothetical protein